MNIISDLIINEEQSVPGYEAAVLLRHAARHQRADHHQRVRRPQRVLVVQDREPEATLALHQLCTT